MNFHFTGKSQARQEAASWFELLEKSFNDIEGAAGRFKVKVSIKDENGNHGFGILYKGDDGEFSPKLTGMLSFESNGDATYTPVLQFNEKPVRLPLTVNTHDKAYEITGRMMSMIFKSEEQAAKAADYKTTLSTTYSDVAENQAPAPAAPSARAQNRWAGAMDAAHAWVQDAFGPRARI